MLSNLSIILTFFCIALLSKQANCFKRVVSLKHSQITSIHSEEFHTQRLSPLNSGGGFSEKKMPKPNIIKPSEGPKGKMSIEKFLMMYTCKICSNRNAQMVRFMLYSFLYYFVSIFTDRNAFL